MIYLSRESYDNLSKELEFLKNERRRALSREVGKARAHGDLRENAEYHAAKEALLLNEKRISEMESQLSRAQILDYRDLPAGEARIGSRVRLKDEGTGEELEYVLVSEIEADFSRGHISVTSPVGRALLGHREGDAVPVKIPAGNRRYRILKVSR